MKFEEIVSKIKCYLEDQSPVILEGNEYESIKDTFEIMTSDIFEMIDGKELEHNNDKFSKVMGSLLILSSLSLDGAISDSFGSFLVYYSEVAFNWNKYTFDDPVIKNLTLHISRLSETRTAMVKCINAMKNVEQRFMLLNNWSPASYDISKAYFEELLKENEKEQV